MDYDALKEQWGEVEDRDGVRLSWNVFPSTRMVSFMLPGPYLVVSEPKG
jgi:protein transport protein SEC23